MIVARFAPLVLLVGVCAAGPGGADPGYALRIARERAELDEDTRTGETTPFTPIEMRMIDPGESISVGVCDGRPSLDPVPACAPRLTHRYGEGGFRLSDRGGQRDPGAVIPLARFRLALSRQEARGRILVHDPASPDQKKFHGYRWYPASGRNQPLDC